MGKTAIVCLKCKKMNKLNIANYCRSLYRPNGTSEYDYKCKCNYEFTITYDKNGKIIADTSDGLYLEEFKETTDIFSQKWFKCPLCQRRHFCWLRGIEKNDQIPCYPCWNKVLKRGILKFEDIINIT